MAGTWPGYPQTTLWESLPRAELYSFPVLFVGEKDFYRPGKIKIIISNTTKMNNMSPVTAEATLHNYNFKAV